jgi:DNA invertase Pin-like site-specific DNA recombinase
MNFVAYYRVSTEKQGKSGLGLESQKNHVTRFIHSQNGEIVGEYTDIESGGKDDRANLKLAILKAKETGAAIVVKKLDRLSRGGFKIATQLEELGIQYIDCESPNDSDFIKDIKFSIAKEERAKIADRISSAMHVIKANIERDGYHISSTGNKITSLGNPEYLGGEKAIQASVKTRRRKAATDPRNRRAKAMIKILKEQGLSYISIAKSLNESGFLTSRGNSFSDVQVRNLYLRDY